MRHPVRIARRSGRPAGAAPGQRSAEKLLSDADVREQLRLDPEALQVLRRCSTRPPRNAAAMVAAIKLRLEYSQSKPKQEIDLNARVTLEQLVEGSMAGTK